MNKIIKNEYEIDGDIAIIKIIRRNGDKFNVLVDIDTLKLIDLLNKKIHVSWHKDINGYYAEICEYLGYINGKPKYKTLLLHRIIMKEKNTKNKVDHINHNTLDNRKNNLRVTIQNKNLKNRESKNKNNTSGYRNVTWLYNKWVVQLQIDGKNKVLGRFTNIDEAGKFAELMRQKYYGEFAGNN